MFKSVHPLCLLFEFGNCSCLFKWSDFILRVWGCNLYRSYQLYGKSVMRGSTLVHNKSESKLITKYSGVCL